MIRRDGEFQRELRNQLSDDGFLQSVEIGADVMVGELVRALATHGMTLTNVAGRGLRIVRAPTPAQEDGR